MGPEQQPVRPQEDATPVNAETKPDDNQESAKPDQESQKLWEAYVQQLRRMNCPGCGDGDEVF